MMIAKAASVALLVAAALICGLGAGDEELGPPVTAWPGSPWGVECGQPCVIENSRGGMVLTFRLEALGLKERHVPIIVDGPCLSACALLVDADRDQVCLTTRAVLGYHQAAYTDDSGVRHDLMLHFETPGLDDFLKANGGLPAQPAILLVSFERAQQFYKACPGAYA